MRDGCRTPTQRIGSSRLDNAEPLTMQSILQPLIAMNLIVQTKEDGLVPNIKPHNKYGRRSHGLKGAAKEDMKCFKITSDQSRGPPA